MSDNVAPSNQRRWLVLPIGAVGAESEYMGKIHTLIRKAHRVPHPTPDEVDIHMLLPISSWRENGREIVKVLSITKSAISVELLLNINLSLPIPPNTQTSLANGEVQLPLRNWTASDLTMDASDSRWLLMSVGLLGRSTRRLVEAYSRERWPADADGRGVVVWSDESIISESWI